MSAAPGEPEPDDTATHIAAATGTDGSSSVSKLIGWSKTTASATQQRLERFLDEHRDRAVVDLGLRWYERDRDAAGTLVGSAIAFRLFLFFVPLLLFVVGLAGFLANYVESQDVADMGVTGNLARQMNDALTQPNSTRWIATLAGLFGMLVAGRSLTKVMAAASCLAWGRPVRAKASVRAIGATVGLVVGLGLVSGMINKIRHDLGIGAAGVSFIAAFALYGTAWLLLSLVLPRTTSDPGALLPGAVLVGATLSGLQAFSQLYLPNRFSQASELYGAVGIAIVTLGWFFIMGRVHRAVAVAGRRGVRTVRQHHDVRVRPPGAAQHRPPGAVAAALLRPGPTRRGRGEPSVRPWVGYLAARRRHRAPDRRHARRTRRRPLTLGPIEVLVIAFPENRFTGEIMPELERLVASGTITIVDGLFVTKDADGNTAFVELAEVDADDDAAALAGVLDHVEGLVSDEDVEAMTADLEPDSSAAILVFEHTWAKPLRDAVVGAGGILAANMRIPGAVVEEILATVPDDLD